MLNSPVWYWLLRENNSVLSSMYKNGFQWIYQVSMNDSIVWDWLKVCKELFNINGMVSTSMASNYCYSFARVMYGLDKFCNTIWFIYESLISEEANSF